MQKVFQDMGFLLEIYFYIVVEVGHKWYKIISRKMSYKF